MQRNVFRKESLDRISSPEQLNDYIRVTNPSVWMMMCAVILLLIGVCVWSVFGRLDTVLSVAAMTEEEQTVCYVKEADAEKLTPDMPVRIGEGQYQISSISRQPVLVDDTFTPYLLHVGGLSAGEWVYPVILSEACGDNGSIQKAAIVIESIAPMRFVLN